MVVFTITAPIHDGFLGQFTLENPGSALRFVVPDLAARPVPATLEVRASPEGIEQFLAEYGRLYGATFEETVREGDVWAGNTEVDDVDAVRAHPLSDVIMEMGGRLSGIITYAEDGLLTLRGACTESVDGYVVTAAWKEALQARGFSQVFVRTLAEGAPMDGWHSLLHRDVEPFGHSIAGN